MTLVLFILLFIVPISLDRPLLSDGAPLQAELSWAFLSEIAQQAPPAPGKEKTAQVPGEKQSDKATKAPDSTQASPAQKPNSPAQVTPSASGSSDTPTLNAPISKKTDTLKIDQDTLPSVVGIVTTEAQTIALPSPIIALTSDSCLTVPKGVTLLNGTAPVTIPDLLRKPGSYELTAKGEKGTEAKLVIQVSREINKMAFTSDAEQIFAGQTKLFAESLILNDSDRLADVQDKVRLPAFVWIVTDSNKAIHSAPNGVYIDHDPNSKKTIKVTARNSKSSVCGKDDVSAEQTFVVLPSPGTLYVDPARSVLLPGSTLQLVATATRQDGLADMGALIDWSITSPSGIEKFISVAPSTGLNVTVIGHFKAADLNNPLFRNTIEIQATWRNAGEKGDPTSTKNANKPSVKAYITPQMVVDFRPIKVKLEPVDDRTAELLFGEGMRKEFYVMRIRLINNLRDEHNVDDPLNPRFLGSSILVFSDSMEMAVSLEKRFNKKSQSNDFKMPSQEEAKAQKDREQRIFDQEKRSYTYLQDCSTITTPDDRGDREWVPVTARCDFEGFLDLNPEYRDYLDNLGKEQPSTGSAVSSIYSLQGSRPRPGGKLEVWEPGDDPGRLICRSDFFYRPYSFEIVLNTATVLEESSGRSLFFKIADGIGLLTSVVTSVAIPGKGSDLPRSLDKYRNIFVPGLQKLWKDMSDTHRQNLVNMTMKPIEEIPFGAELSKIVFFPRRPFTGFVRGHYTRIGQVCPYYFHATAAILSNDTENMLQKQPNKH